MLRSRIHSYRLVLLVLGVLAGCGGGGGTSPAPATHSGAGSSALTVHIDVPLVGTAATRRPAYVSPATQSLAVAVLDGSQQQIGTFSVNVTPSSPSCQTVVVGGVATLTCSLTLPLAIPASGTYTLATTTYDQAQTQQCSPTGTPRCAGNLLSASLMATTLQVNATNTVSMVLGGLANNFTVTPVLSGFFQGNVAGLHIWGPQPQSVVVQALDAAGFTITGTGTPVLTLTSASPTAQITTVSPGLFSVRAAVTGSPAVVTPGAVTLTATATPVGSPATPFSQAIPLTIAHTAVFVSDGTIVPVFLDGNTTPSLHTLSNVNSPRGIAVDANGTVYVGNHSSPNGTVTECTAASEYATCTVPISGPQFIEGVAVDTAGNLWTSVNGSDLIEYAAGSGTQLVDIPFALGNRGVAVDANGILWAANQSPSSVSGFMPPFSSSSVPFVTLTGIDAPIALSADGSGNLWVANCGIGYGGSNASVVTQYAPPIGSASMPAITLTGSNGVSNAQGVAVDATATVWIANNGSGGSVTQCHPPAGTIACTSFLVSGALWIGVYPSDIDP